ncbi:hypothetical protein [Methylosinus sporium]|uniref:hypothetical protein n=1 Tax=Methylosinus sporium TaxID=428 RepID=UPI0011B24D2F|nr:hypothetical protein [Methylosinus sporium]
MLTNKFKAAITAVDWNSNVCDFLSDQPAIERLAAANLRLAVWSRQLENADAGNPALSFIREMQIAGQHVAALVALSLYKPASAQIRAVFECALFYTYFRTHHSELATLVRSPEYFLDKKEIIDYHKVHSEKFSELQHKIGLVSQINKWYSKISAIVHGQIPGSWVGYTKIADIKTAKPTYNSAIDLFIQGVDIVHRLLLCTVAQVLWNKFSTTAKKQLLAGMSGEQKSAMGLDAA